MESDLPIRCRCGSVRGTATRVTPSIGNRVVCYCDDCQAFARWLGCADEVLDRNGGTDIFQTSCAHLEIEDGVEKLAAMRLSERGLTRWYASCCRTPIGNVMSPRLPFVGLIVQCLHGDGGKPIDEAIGPVRGRVMGKFATGDRTRLQAARGFSLPMVVRPIWIAFRAWLRGDDRKSPFYDPEGLPVAEPTVLTDEERQKLLAKRPT